MKKSQIFWDSYGFENPNSGIYSHASQLLPELLKLGASITLLAHDPINSLDDIAQVYFEQSHNLQRKFKPLWMSESKRLFHSSKQGPAIFHGLNNFNAIATRQDSCILTLHDLIPIIAAREVSISQQLQYRLMMKSALRKAHRIICVSKWTMNTCGELFPESRSRLIHIPNGRHKAKMTIVPRETNRILLSFVSRFEKYKGFDRAVEILRDGPESIQIDAVTNEKGREYFSSHAQEHIRNGRLRIHSNLSPGELQKIITESHMLLHCSSYEGFCLPAAEAISLARPVVYQKGSGIDEVVKDHGLGLMPNSLSSDWIAAIMEIHGKWSQDASGFLRVFERNSPEHLSWSEVAMETYKVYNELSV